MADFDILIEIRRRALACIVPSELIPLSRWIEDSILLPEGLCACPGPMRLYSYQRAIADAIGDPDIERVTLQKAARIGFSVLVAAAIGHFTTNDPSPVICLLPVESDCKDFVASDLEPLFAASPALAGILRDSSRVGQRGKSRSTMLSRFFPGGSLRVVASKAPRNLRAKTARVLFIDEADAMSMTGEGSPIDLAEKRTLTFADRKIVLGSTPLDEETSHVCKAYAASDMRVFEVPCPACGSFTEIKWSNIEWQAGEPKTAAFRCPHCSALVDETHKPAMVAAGRWRPTAPEVRGHAGFKLNALVSLLHNARWSVLAAEFLAGKDDPERLQVFVNTVLGEPWRQQGDEVDEGALATRVEPFGLHRIPPDVLCITVGCDLQDDRAEATFAGFARDGTCFVLAHQIVHGPMVGEQVWQDLDDLLKQRWQHPHGGSIGVDAAALDAGDGGVYDKVLRFAAARASRRIFAIKGMGGFSRPAFKVSQVLKGRASQRLYIVGVDGIKSLLFQRLKRGQSIRFSDSLDATYFEQLASERLITKYLRGRPDRRFERIPGRRAETLDALVYALAAREGLALNMDSREAALRLEPQSTPVSRVTRSRWLDGL
ncbi:MAG TPA: terminase gpA endonuclease subunit [Methylocella sp.]|jgi:phage terminase large subunit GpA-like protein